MVLTVVAAVWLVERRAGASAASAAFRSGLVFGILAGFLALSGGLAATGRLSFESRPPSAAVLILGVTLTTIALASSQLGRRVAAWAPLAMLVALQGFRLPLELVMHRAATEGVMPPQMSYSGLNFDIVTGATALLVAAALPFARRWRGPLVLAWNILGSALLLGIIVISWLSAPTPLRVFMNEPANVWVTQAPFIWLPVFLVQLALFGHIVTSRALAMRRSETLEPGLATAGAA